MIRPLVSRIAIFPFVLLVRAYQVTLSPLMGGQCRFEPSCSKYSLEAFREHGAIRGSWLTFRRIMKCHPLGPSGYDPVPLPKDPTEDQSGE